MNASARVSRWNRISSSISARACGPRNRRRRKRRRNRGSSRTVLSRGAQDERERPRIGHELGGLRFQPRAAGAGGPIVPCPPVVLGESPFGRDQAALFYAVQRMIERAVVHAERT